MFWVIEATLSAGLVKLASMPIAKAWFWVHAMLLVGVKLAILRC